MPGVRQGERGMEQTRTRPYERGTGNSEEGNEMKAGSGGEPSQEGVRNDTRVGRRGEGGERGD